jgi:hypothetical protein
LIFRVLRKFLDLQQEKQQIILKAFGLLILVRLGLWLLPYKILQRCLETLFPSPVTYDAQEAAPAALETIPWAVRAASAYVPSATCLTQALTLRTLLAQEGIPSKMEIGVTRDDEAGFAAHAWLEAGGRVVIGGERLDRYTRLERRE